MKNIILSYNSAIWLLLVFLTVTSFFLGEQNSLLDGFRTETVSTAMLLIGFFKVRLVGLHFMELRHAPWPLRLAFEAWVLIVGTVILSLYWL